MKYRINIGFSSVLCAVVSMIVFGCASMMKGSTHQITLNSTPSPATVIIKGTNGVEYFNGKTPVVVKLSKSREYVVTISLAGYQDATANVTKDGIEGWFWANILCGGVIGVIVDASNGAMNKLTPEQVSLDLRTASIPGQEDALYAVFKAFDEQGQLRQMFVPLTKSLRLEKADRG